MTRTSVEIQYWWKIDHIFCNEPYLNHKNLSSAIYTWTATLQTWQSTSNTVCQSADIILTVQSKSVKVLLFYVEDTPNLARQNLAHKFCLIRSCLLIAFIWWKLTNAVRVLQSINIFRSTDTVHKIRNPNKMTTFAYRQLPWSVYL